MSLHGRVAVVTGAGRGIGEAVVRALAAEGVAVGLLARTAGEIEEVAGEVRAGGGRATAVVCDVTEPAAVVDARDAVASALGPADILVNNAGASSSAPLARTALDEWRRLMDVNATGTFLCTKVFLPGMLERGWGRIVNVASVAGLTAGKYVAAYAASKHAQVGLTRAVAAEVADRGVTVNAVCPGYVDTPMTRASVARIRERTGRTEEEALAALKAQNPQGRLIDPGEVAHAVLALCAEDARGINGQTLVIDGGHLLA